MYSQKVMNHFLHPRNVGSLDAGAGVGSGTAENPDCGDTVILDVQVAGGAVTAARFRSTGCAGAIACCSAVTEWLIGRSVVESAAVDAAAVENHLGGLPASKRGCAAMAAAAARAAVAAASGA
jgi:nitrogen fixation NifU-like protein